MVGSLKPMAFARSISAIFPLYRAVASSGLVYFISYPKSLPLRFVGSLILVSHPLILYS